MNDGLAAVLHETSTPHDKDYQWLSTSASSSRPLSPSYRCLRSLVPRSPIRAAGRRTRPIAITPPSAIITTTAGSPSTTAATRMPTTTAGPAMATATSSRLLLAAALAAALAFAGCGGTARPHTDHQSAGNPGPFAWLQPSAA